MLFSLLKDCAQQKCITLVRLMKLIMSVKMNGKGDDDNYNDEINSGRKKIPTDMIFRHYLN